MAASMIRRLGTRLAMSALGLLCNLAFAGCMDRGPTEGGGDTLSLSVSISGALVAPKEAVLIWEVGSSALDTAFVWGRAPVIDGRFELDLDERPPKQAMNAHGVAVGVVATTLDPSFLRDGTLSAEVDERKITGLSDDHAIIYADHAVTRAYIDAHRAEASLEDLDRAMRHWLFDFPDGYSCGVGVPAAPGELLDTFAPVRCSEFEVHQADLSTLTVTNWN